jgi:SSS family solute:Na+ symporter
MPGLMGIIASAVMAASMSSLDSAFNSLSTVSTLDFYKKYYKPNESDHHYLNVSRMFTVFWAAIIIVPAIMYHLYSTGSILEVLSKVGSYFVGAQLGMFGLGFFSKHASERGLLVGTLVGVVAVAYTAIYTDVAWPWYAAIGAFVNVFVTIIASIAIDGKQTEYSPYTVKGQIKSFADSGAPTTENGWYLVPGKVDKVCYSLFGFFVFTLVFLFSFELFI